jgi:hypothetical protein
MSKIVRVSESDYRLKVKDTGTITLDTGVDVGTVIITGDLLVKGGTTTVDTTNLTIEDNIILLNKGENPSHAGVTEGSSGLQIDRGSLDDAQFIFNETGDLFTFRTVNSSGVETALLGVKANSYAGSATGNVQFDLQSGAGTLRVINTTNYESRVLDPDDIPNLQYLQDYVLAYDGAAVVDKIFSPISNDPFASDTLVQALASSIRFSVRSGGVLSQRAQITANGLSVDEIRLYNDTIQNTGADNLILTALNNNVQINGVLNLDNQITDATPSGGTSRIYSKSTGGVGKSGIYFANNTASDELVSRKRAVLLSILF